MNFPKLIFLRVLRIKPNRSMMLRISYVNSVNGKEITILREHTMLLFFLQGKDQHKNFVRMVLFVCRMPLCNSRTSTTNENKCDTLGITELGTMCNRTSNCAVIRDNGFATAFTIAHEIAHL